METPKVNVQNMTKEVYTEFTPQNVVNIVKNIIAIVEKNNKKIAFKESQRKKEMNTEQDIHEYLKDVEDAKTQELIWAKVIMQVEWKKAKRYREARQKLQLDNYYLYKDHLSLQLKCDEEWITDEVNSLLTEI